MARSRVSGHKETARAIRKIANTMQRPVAEASRKALIPILNASVLNLVQNGSVVTGDLAKGMAIRAGDSKPGNTQLKVAATGDHYRVAHLVEFGTDPHWQPKLNRMHPGAQPYPFLTPAYDQHDKLAIEIFGDEIGGALERQAARLNKKVR